MIYKYSVDEKNIENSYEMEIDWSIEGIGIEYIINVCANDYYYNNDGWERNWPLDFHLFDKNGTFIKSFEMHLEFTPEFSAVEK